MTIEKTVLVPLSAEETFALLTEPERLRRWQLVSARMDLRAGGDFRWTVVPGAQRGGDDPRGRTGQARRLHVGLGRRRA